MSFSLLITFVISSVFIIASPGPAVTLLLSTGLTQGKQAAYKLVPGIGLGSLFAMLLALIGVGAIISASILAFNIVKVIGIIYLIYIGVKMWVDSSKISITSKIDEASSKMSELKSGFLISFLNPKIIIFFSSFIPQYIDKEQPFFYQAFFLGGIYLLLVLFNGYFYGYFADKLALFLKNPSSKWISRLGSIFMILSAILIIN